MCTSRIFISKMKKDDITMLFGSSPCEAFTLNSITQIQEPTLKGTHVIYKTCMQPRFLSCSQMELKNATHQWHLINYISNKNNTPIITYNYIIMQYGRHLTTATHVLNASCSLINMIETFSPKEAYMQHAFLLNTKPEPCQIIF